jgi:hypothetical protein
MTDSSADKISAELIAVLVAVTSGVPRVLTIGNGGALPSGPLKSSQRSMQAGLRAWVEWQTGHALGYIEQLYSFADQGRSGRDTTISVSYLALTREAGIPPGITAAWQDWYRYFPWEDRRSDNRLIETVISPRLAQWAGASAHRRLRVASCFGLDGEGWNEELALARYELLYEIGMVSEAALDGRPNSSSRALGMPMIHDHRRILATAISRLRAKIKYRPVVFELMQETFTLLDLQRAVEALAGRVLHKQNFRRLMEAQELVEETGKMTNATAGRPAKLFRFRSQVLAERAYGGTRLPLARS